MTVDKAILNNIFLKFIFFIAIHFASIQTILAQTDKPNPVLNDSAYFETCADFSFIAGGIVPGVLVIKPDFPENKED